MVIQKDGLLPQYRASFAVWQSGQVSDDHSGATFSSFDHVGAKSLRSAAVWGRMNHAQIRDQAELESIKAKRQAFPDGLQRGFFEAPELEKSLLTYFAAWPFNSPGFGPGKKPMSEFRSLQFPGLVFAVDADSMRPRPRPGKAETTGGETKPDLR